MTHQYIYHPVNFNPLACGSDLRTADLANVFASGSPYVMTCTAWVLINYNI